MVARLALLLSGLALLPSGGAIPAQQPTPEQARSLLERRPELVRQLRDQLASSGLSRDQIRARLVALGYPANLLDAYLDGRAVDSLGPSQEIVAAVRALGVGNDAVTTQPSERIPGVPGEPRNDLMTISDPGIFGLDVFRRVTSQFDAVVAGPVDASYRLGPGDALVLILTGDVELAHTLEVTREGFVVIPQVGQLFVSGLTLAGLESLLYTRLGRVYSGVSRSPSARTKFQITVSRLRTNQIFVVGDVLKPGSYQMSSAGTALTALYLAGGPTDRGSLRRIEIRRGREVIDTLDVYDYLLRGDNAHDVRLETGDVVFVPVRGPHVAVSGAITRPAIYELGSGETLRDLVDAAGGFDPTALRRRIQIERILAPADRGPGGRDRVLLDLGPDQLSDSLPPPFPLLAGDRVKVFSVSERTRDQVTVRGNVWVEGPVGFVAGMRLSDAIRIAGGPKPDVYLDQILISRLRPDSTRRQLRSAFADSTGRITDDLVLREDDDIQVFSRTSFRPARYVVVTGAVRRPGRVRYREGITLRDAILEAQGLTEEAWLAEVEIARLPSGRLDGQIASTLRAPLDSTYLFDRGPNGEYAGPPGLPARASGAPETELLPYDNVLVFRQPDWELQRVVTITGQVRFPGKYALRSKTERITDLIARSGGLAPEAYPPGAALFRRFEQRRQQLKVIDRLEAVRDSVAPTPTDSTIDLDAWLAQRVGLDLTQALSRPDARQNVILQAGDSLHIPEYDPTIRVLGAVNSPTSLLHRPGWDVDDYVAAAGGYSRQADKGRSYVVQPNGRLESVKRRFLLPDSKPEPRPGGVVYVPDRDPNDRKDWAGLLGSIAQVLASTVAIIVVATR
ncbi:MAG: SLBB domain-containing protein [Gemmatimonadales bacterium]